MAADEPSSKQSDFAWFWGKILLPIAGVFWINHGIRHLSEGDGWWSYLYGLLLLSLGGFAWWVWTKSVWPSVMKWWRTSG
ncbi:hypothetical protein [Streptosporangium lutulentum]|uniref:Uncharacterized protein n=1 Tax=Streptosporangium lutulentum TaxID=1461250 RepID=A0ABT9QJG5_9ACTN|nr:hypothetical protein [Streptosporangium lutulentum]MDP9846897.1 hypothetical protein [Streptosporangium lutulentum]